mgnify:CR=1 FL=1
MLTIKTKIGPSKIQGIGLFADEEIPKGTIVWKFNPLIDISLSKEELKKLSKESKEQIKKYAYLDKYSKKYVLCGDDGRFFNHSDSPNCDGNSENKIINNITTALRSIKNGEELTVNYKLFYENMDEHPKISSAKHLK